MNQQDTPRYDTVLHMLSNAVTIYPESDAIVFGETRLTYRVFGSCVARYRKALGIDFRGRRVAILLHNSADLAVAYFGVLAAEAHAVLLNPNYTPRELSLILEDADPALILYSESCSTAQKTFLRACNYASQEVHNGQLVDQYSQLELFDIPAIDPEAIAIIQYTGGTSGRPKGVELSHRALSTNVWQRQCYIPVGMGNERILCAMPLFHAFAMSMCLFLSVYSAGCLVILERYQAKAVLDAISKERISIFPAGPTVFSGLLASKEFSSADFSSLKICCSGSAPISEETLLRWETATAAPIFEGYGMTEASPVISFNPVSGVRKSGSVGLPVLLTKVEIVDVETGTRRLGKGEKGEVRVAGPQLMRGYRNLTSDTLQTIRGGWLYTGDIGELDADGYLFLRDRKKDMAIVGGYNVFPREVEEVIYSHENVAEAAVVIVPDAFYGQRLVAFVTPLQAAESFVSDLQNHCETNLVKYKRPLVYHVMRQMPKTAVGKIDKLALKEQALKES
jgi:long-chain acyl-CoA synthetase